MNAPGMGGGYLTLSGVNALYAGGAGSPNSLIVSNSGSVILAASNSLDGTTTINTGAAAYFRHRPARPEWFGRQSGDFQPRHADVPEL